MKKFKKMKENFKEQNLLGKIRIIFFGTLTTIILVFIAWIIIHPIYNFCTDTIDKYTVAQISPLSSEYSVLTYQNGNCRIVRREGGKQLGERFLDIEYEKTIRDSIVFLFTKDKKIRTFSIKTGKFSEESFDHIDLPDPIHHYSACSKKGMLGFIDCHTGKIVIPLKFYANNYFFVTERTKWRPFSNFESSAETYTQIDEFQCDKYRSIISACRRNSKERYDDDYWDEDAYDEDYWDEDDINDDDLYEEHTDGDDTGNGIIQFKGDFCVVPTTVVTCGVIDTNGNLLLDGYDWISYIGQHKIFKTARDHQYSLFTIDQLQSLHSNQSEIFILPIGILLPQSSILTNHACTDTLTNLVIDDENHYGFLDEYGYGNYKRVYKCWEMYHGKKIFNTIDNTYKLIRNKSTNYRVGVLNVKNGRIAIKPMWEDVRIYKNANNKYLFSCLMNGYRFLMDENGNILSKK